MDKDELSVLPAEARGYQGAAAGIATRFAASAIDGFVVVVWLLAVYGGYVVLRLVLSPGGFHPPNPSLLLVGAAFFWTEVVYLAFAWWIGGRTLGDRVMGVQVVPNGGGRLRFMQSVARALLCAVFPIGLLWCAIDPKRRSLQDIVLRTSVVYNWLPRATTTSGH
jgi:uncharacterized RDD family membrane protein YckC